VSDLGQQQDLVYDPGGGQSSTTTIDLLHQYVDPLGPYASAAMSYITTGPPTPDYLLAPPSLGGYYVAPEEVEPEVFYDAPEVFDVVETVEDVFVDALEFLPEFLLL
jgi:hypothetical protein